MLLFCTTHWWNETPWVAGWMLSEVQLTWACNFNTSPPFHENILSEKETDTKSGEEWTCRKLTYESTTLLAPLVYAPGALIIIIIIIAAVGGFLFNPEEYSVCSISFRPVPRQEVSSFLYHPLPTSTFVQTKGLQFIWTVWSVTWKGCRTLRTIQYERSSKG